MKVINPLGQKNFGQRSIDEHIDRDAIYEIFLSNIAHFEDYVKKSNDYYAKELLDELKNYKKFTFPFSKSVEMFIFKNKKDIKKIIKYIIFRYKFYISGAKKIDLGYPPYLLIEPVSSCNLKCPFCFQVDKSFTRKPYMGVMDFNFFKEIIDQANELGSGAITLASRGEPTMHKKYIDMLKYIYKKENIFELKTNTNGTYLNEEMCHAIFKYNVTTVVISSDHYIKKEYERLRLGSNFEKVVENVDRLYEIRKKFYPDAITEIRISGIDNDRHLDRKEFKNFWIKRSDHVTASYPLERWDTYNNKPHDKITDGCEYLWDRMYVWFDGKTNPCDADYKSYLNYGDAKKNSLKKIWNDKIIEKTRRMHLAKERNKIVPCDRCGVTFA